MGWTKWSFITLGGPTYLSKLTGRIQGNGDFGFLSWEKDIGLVPVKP